MRTFIHAKQAKAHCTKSLKVTILSFKIEVSFECWESLLHRSKSKILVKSNHLDVRSNFVNCNRQYFTV